MSGFALRGMTAGSSTLNLRTSDNVIEDEGVVNLAKENSTFSPASRCKPSSSVVPSTDGSPFFSGFLI